MINSIVRTDRWQLSLTQIQSEYLKQTEKMYRSYARALIGVVITSFPQIASADSPCAAVEKLIHQTTKNPLPRYRYFSKNFYKFPSYLRRAVIQAAVGQVSSFVTRYNIWQQGRRNRRDALPPKLNAALNLHFENLKGWRPKGGSTCFTLRQRFHGWLKSRLVQLTADKFTELGGKVEFVFPRGTSSYAYESSQTEPRMPALLCSLWSLSSPLIFRQELSAGCIHITLLTIAESKINLTLE